MVISGLVGKKIRRGDSSRPAAEYYASFSTDGGVTWAANTRLSGGFSNAADAANGVDYGDYMGASIKTNFFLVPLDKDHLYFLLTADSGHVGGWPAWATGC